jgi:predicted CXXCH cytochrome family protein
MSRRVVRSTHEIRRLTGFLVILFLAAIVPVESYSAGNPYDEVERTVHNILPPSGSFTLKDLCLSCHVDGNIYVPGMPLPTEEASLPIFPVFGSPEEQKPAWEPDTTTKTFDVPKSWPLPRNMSPERPFGISADCLGCHDGAIAADVHQGKERRGAEGATALSNLLDRLEARLGTNPSRPTSAIPDHPISTIYPISPDGTQLIEKVISSQTRYFPIPDLQDEQLVLPTARTSQYYAQTPGNPKRGQTDDEAKVLARAADEGDDPREQFRLIHTTFGVMHCDSCHNAHSELHAGFLRDKSPQLCLVCHDR